MLTFSEMGDNRRIAQVRTARSVICRISLLDGKLFEIDVDVSIVIDFLLFSFYWGINFLFAIFAGLTLDQNFVSQPGTLRP
jgi:hypothetical protein